jgi:hypothetical protein
MTQMNSVRRDPRPDLEFRDDRMQPWEYVAWGICIGFWLGLMAFINAPW